MCRRPGRAPSPPAGRAQCVYGFTQRQHGHRDEGRRVLPAPMRRSPGRSSASPAGHGTRSRCPRPPGRRPRSSSMFRRRPRRSRQPPGRAASTRAATAGPFARCFSGDTLGSDRRPKGLGTCRRRRTRWPRWPEQRNLTWIVLSTTKSSATTSSRRMRLPALDLRRADRPARRGLRRPARGPDQDFRTASASRSPELRAGGTACRGSKREPRRAYFPAADRRCGGPALQPVHRAGDAPLAEGQAVRRLDEFGFDDAAQPANGGIGAA